MKTANVVAAIIRDGDKVFATQRGYGDYKDGWEFPGGKIEPGETPQQALVREIKEELDTDIAVGDCLTTVEYDYPAFHLSMQCFWCKIVDGKPVLKEHEAARWLDAHHIDSVDWLPADLTIIELIKDKPFDKRFLIIKSWNEWAEGNYLEPDLKYGRQYLEAVKSECVL